MCQCFSEWDVAILLSQYNSGTGVGECPGSGSWVGINSSFGLSSKISKGKVVFSASSLLISQISVAFVSYKHVPSYHLQSTLSQVATVRPEDLKICPDDLHKVLSEVQEMREQQNSMDIKLESMKRCSTMNAPWASIERQIMREELPTPSIKLQIEWRDCLESRKVDLLASWNTSFCSNNKHYAMLSAPTHFEKEIKDLAIVATNNC